MRRVGRTRIEFVVLTAIVLSIVGAWPVVVTNACSADEPTQPPSAVDAESPPPGDLPDRETPQEAARKRKAYAGLAAVAAIAIVGVCLSALTILWAGRLRRQLRQPLPEGEPSGSEFWFLKPPKPAVGESSLLDSHQPPHKPPPAEPS